MTQSATQIENEIATERSVIFKSVRLVLIVATIQMSMEEEDTFVPKRVVRETSDRMITVKVCGIC
jgi:hypothetical protein